MGRTETGCGGRPGATVVRHASARGAWTLVRAPPAPALRPFVHEYQGYEETGGTPVVRRELPSPRIPLILDFGRSFSLHHTAHDPARPGRSEPLPAAFVAGLHGAFTVVGSAGAAHCMQVDLTPLGARRILGLPMGELAGRVADLADVLGAAAGHLADRLRSAPGWEARFAILDVALARRVADAPAPPPLAEAAWAALAASGGALRVADLARSLGVGRGHLSQTVAREVGMAPKPLARLMRFDRAVEGLRRGQVRTLADLAAACGYYDQAHLDRDVRAFAGESPTRLMRRMLPDGTGVMA